MSSESKKKRKGGQLSKSMLKNNEWIFFQIGKTHKHIHSRIRVNPKQDKLREIHAENNIIRHKTKEKKNLKISQRKKGSLSTGEDNSNDNEFLIKIMNDNEFLIKNNGGQKEVAQYFLSVERKELSTHSPIRSKINKIMKTIWRHSGMKEI